MLGSDFEIFQKCFVNISSVMQCQRSRYNRGYIGAIAYLMQPKLGAAIYTNEYLPDMQGHSLILIILYIQILGIFAKITPPTLPTQQVQLKLSAANYTNEYLLGMQGYSLILIILYIQFLGTFAKITPLALPTYQVQLKLGVANCTTKYLIEMQRQRLFHILKFQKF